MHESEVLCAVVLFAIVVTCAQYVPYLEYAILCYLILLVAHRASVWLFRLSFMLVVASVACCVLCPHWTQQLLWSWADWPW